MMLMILPYDKRKYFPNNDHKLPNAIEMMKKCELHQDFIDEVLYMISIVSVT